MREDDKKYIHKSKGYPGHDMKVLIISHNPVSTLSSIGKTLLSLFSSFCKEELCQLYIHTGEPDTDICTSYYRITDREVLSGFFKRRVRGGCVGALAPGEQKQEEAGVIYRHTYGISHNKGPHTELLRDLMWKLSPWYNKELKEWLDSQKPTCIFVAVGSGMFLYDMALKISSDYNIPVVSYVCDDFYFMKTPKKFAGKLWKKRLERKSRELFGRSAVIVSICEEISRSYESEFGTRAVTVMTGTNYSIAREPVVSDEVRHIRYFGKLGLNRYKSLIDICNVLNEINSETNSEYRVEIYGSEEDDKICRELSGTGCAEFRGFITGNEFDRTLFSSDILIHTEAFDDASVDRVKNSVSTKIADSLASGIPLLAYGPRSVASIQHLLRNNCGAVATDREELKDKMSILLADKEFRKSVSEADIRTAHQYHDSVKNSRMLYGILMNVQS